MSGKLFAVNTATAEAEPKPAAPSFGDALAATKTAPKPAAKKSTVPTLETPPEIKEAVDQYQDAKTNMKQAEATMNAAGEILTAFTREAIDRDGFAGKYHNSFALIGNRHQAKVIFANKWTINPEDESELAALLGENFAELIDKKFTVKLRPEVFEDKQLQAELMSLIGERFAEFFETEAKLTVREGFDRDLYRVVSPEQLPTLRTWARQYKPSIR